MSSPVLLQQFTFNGTIAPSGSLALVPTDSATTLGTPVYVAGPGSSQALSFPNITYLRVPYNSSISWIQGQPLSCGGWFYLDVASASTSNEYMSNFVSTSGTELYISNGSNISCNVLVNGSYSVYQSTGLMGGVTSPIARWAHFWTTYDGTVIRMYIDGVLQVTTSTLTQSFQSTDPWLIMCTRNSPGLYHSSGAVADVRWYSGMVTAATAMISTAPSPPVYVALDNFDNSLTITKGLVVPPTVSGQATGSISATTVIGGTAPYSYAWQSFSSTAITATNAGAQANLAAGLYVLQTTDSAGAVTLTKYRIIDPMLVTLTTSNVTLSGINNGSATAVVTGGYSSMSGSTLTYQWLDMNGTVLSKTSTVSNLLPGTYTFNAFSTYFAQTLQQTSSFTITTSNTQSATLLAVLPCNGNTNLVGQSVQPTVVIPANTTVAYVAGPYAGSQGLDLSVYAPTNFSLSTYGSVTIPFTSALNFDCTAAWSFGGWFNDNSWQGQIYAYLSNMRGSSFGLEFLRNYSSALRVNFGASASSSSTSSNTSVYTNVQQVSNTQSWNHLWITYSGPAPATNIIQIWRNGVIVGNSNSVGTTNFSSTAGWTIANGQIGGSFPLIVSDIRWYSGVMNPYTAMQPLVPLIVTLTPTPASSSTASDGSIVAAATGYGGALSYLWNTGATTAVITGLPVGLYTCVVTDAAGNKVTQQTYIVNPVTLNLTKTDAIATGTVNNSTITSTLMQAVVGASYSYSWTKDSFVCSSVYSTATTSTITSAMPNAFPGYYTLTVSGYGVTNVATMTVVSGVATPAATCLVNLQMNGSVLDSGSLGLSPSTTSMGSTVAFVPGQTSGALALQIPLNGYFTVPYSSSIDYSYSTPLSFGGWFNISAFGLNAQLMANEVNTNNTSFYSCGMQLQLTLAQSLAPGVAVWNSNSNSSSAAAAYNTTSSLQNSWNHFWVCFSPVNNRIIVYVNGIALTYGNVGNSFANSQSPWLIGASARSGGYFSGAVANVRFYNQIIDPISVMQSTAVPTTTLVVTNVTVSGTATGGATVNVAAIAGRTYTYLWSTGESTSTVSGKVAGSYTVTVSDSTGLTVTRAVTITQPMGATYVSTPATLSANGTITLTIVGGSGSATVVWKNSTGTVIPAANPLMLTGVGSGTYTYVITSGGLTATGTAIVQSNLQFSTTPTSVLINYNAVAGASLYKIVYSIGTSNVFKTFSSTNNGLSALVSGLLSNQLYNFQVFATIAGVSSLQAVGSSATPGNLISNYSKAALATPALVSVAAPVYSVATLISAAAASGGTQSVENSISSIFATGDRIKSNATIGLSTVPVVATVVSLNTTIPVTKNISVYVPFDKTVATVQTASLKLSNNTVVPVTFDSAADTVTLNGSTYVAGNKFVLDGQVVTVTEI